MDAMRKQDHPPSVFLKSFHSSGWLHKVGLQATKFRRRPSRRDCMWAIHRKELENFVDHYYG